MARHASRRKQPAAHQLVPRLLDWFHANARDLPWRRTCDPYAIWISEIMLQQTQVKTVIPYWERWMRELPNIAAAAKAKPARLHKLWEGLGYYTRVRNLQKAAQRITAQPNGEFPQNFDDILELPGIGRYTAGAIASIAFNQPHPILDGNVIRVLTRLHGIATEAREKKTNVQLWQLAEKLVAHAARRDASRSSRLSSGATISGACAALNQSLMELGALICTPRSPQCSVCPVATLCIARKKNLQKQLPNLGRRAAATALRFIAFVVERDGKFLVRQRPAGVVNAHLWEFPNVEGEAPKSGTRESVRAAAWPSGNGAQRMDAPDLAANLRLTGTAPLGAIKHSITRYRITLEAWRAEPTSKASKFPGRWLTPRQLHQLAFTSAHKKILDRLRSH